MDFDTCSPQACTSEELADKISPKKLSGSQLTWASYLFTNQNLPIKEAKKEEIPQNNEVSKIVDCSITSYGDMACTCNLWYWCGCAKCSVYSSFYPMDPNFESFMTGIEKGSQNFRQTKPGTEKINKRIQGLNGSVTRGVDLRHLPKWVDQPTYFMTKFMKSPNFVDEKGKLRKEPKALQFNVPEREKLVTEETFGMNSYNVPYSLGKRSRWNFSEVFEKNSDDFQHPYHNITTILITSTQLPKPQQIYSEQFPPLINGAQSSCRVKRLIGAESNGKMYTKESQSGKALPVDLLKPVAPLPRQTRQQPKHKKAARRFRRQEMLRKKLECQEAPIRLTYVIDEPRPTTKQLDSDALRHKFTNFMNGKKCPRLQKHRSLLIQQEDTVFYNETMDFDADGSFGDEGFEDYHCKSPIEFTLADFIQVATFIEDIMPNFVFVEKMTGDFAIIGQKQLKRHFSEMSNSSTLQDYELIDEFNFEN